ncbi:MAG: HD domain-containing protein [Patescibacteria group bacterium]|nr:HD domain-containing protein [Patescibacteria group bacterium]
MKGLLNFLIEINKLKEIPRTGWVLMGVKNPETIADHTFRTAFLAWLLGQKKKLNLKRIIKSALSHDLCEVYAGDITPFFYYPQLPKKKKERKKILMKWARLSEKEKKKIGEKKFNKEKTALLRLIKFFNPKVKNEIFSLWYDYEKGILEEGKFVRQLNRVETLLQSINYFGSNIVKSGNNWWEWVEEIVEDPLLLDFLKVIQKKFYGKRIRIYRSEEKELEGILDFFLKIGKLKRLPRLYWLLRKVKNPETVAGHIFTLTMMAWILGRERKELDLEKLLKMALCHELSAIYTGDTTPYDEILSKTKKSKKEILKKLPRLSKKEKMEMFLKDYQEEKRAFEKITLTLKPSLKREIIQLWEEYRTKSTPEGYFLPQLNVLAILLQGLLYEKKDKDFFTFPLWEWAFEICDHPLTLGLLEEMKKKFY